MYLKLEKKIPMLKRSRKNEVSEERKKKCLKSEKFELGVSLFRTLICQLMKMEFEN